MSRRAWSLFAVVSVLWGIPYLLIKVAVEGGLSPAVVSSARCAIGAAILLPLAWRAGALGALRGRMRWVAAFTVVELAIPFPLIAAGEQRISSSLAAILIAAMPLVVTTLMVRIDPSQRPNALRIAGMVVGFGGVVLMLGVDVAGSSEELVGAALVLLAMLGYAVGPLIMDRRLTGLDGRAAMGASLGLASLLLLPLALVTAPSGTVETDAVLSVVALGVLCSAAAFVAMFALVREAGPPRAALITYVNPAVAVLLGVTILGEELTAAAIAGLLLILAGSYLATGGRPPSLRRRPAAVPSPG